QGSAEAAGQYEHWEAVRFELEHPATVHAIRVRVTALGDLREDDEWQLGLYGDFGNNGFDFDRWNPLWEGSRCGEDIERDAWVTFALDEPIEVAEAGLVFVANHRQNLRSPGWVFSENRSEDGDGVDNSADVFPSDGEEWVDTDGDGIGDNRDPDRDNDGFSNDVEQTAGSDDLDPESKPRDLDKDGIVDVLDDDMDGDSYLNEDDAFPEDASEWADFDGDGYADVLVNGLKLYRNSADGSFEDVTEAAGLAGVSGSGIWGDLDNDGCLDLVAFGNG
ncbi:MAG TPA: VCBS repeat-containing protein, partial [Cytophagales bacterium]|nr:VCBS repeat-containing protein [Cytophagales bacterium]